MNRTEFQSLAGDWYRGTAYLSTSPPKMKHPAIKKIIDGGWESLPFILEELHKEHGHWYEPIHRITGVVPIIPPEFWGRISFLDKIYANFLEDILNCKQRTLE